VDTCIVEAGAAEDETRVDSVAMAAFELDGAGGETEHVPNLELQPVPQYALVLPHQLYLHSGQNM
jgi:hypothetical protein